MYQVHTKSIKVCRISNMIQYKEKRKKKNKKFSDSQKSRPYSTFKGI